MLKCHFDIKPEGLTVQTQGKEVKAEAFLSVCKQMMKKFPKAKKVITNPKRFYISFTQHMGWSYV